MSEAEELAWTIIANVSEGDWSKQTKEWQQAAGEWRDAYAGSGSMPEDSP